MDASGLIVEVGMMGIQADKTPLDSSTPDGRILLEAWTSIIAAPGGPKRIFWGVETASPERIWAWFDWPSLEAHEKFARSFGGKATSRFGEVFTPGFTKHAHHSTSPLRSPVTQVLAAFFPSDISTKVKESVEQAFERLERDILKKSDMVRGWSGGWGMESDFPMRRREDQKQRQKLSDEGREIETGAVFFVLVGWETVDEGFMEEVRESLALMVEMQGAVAWDEFRVRCEVLERE